jgi:flagellar biosynthesis protein FlhF
MRIRRYYGNTIREAIHKVREEQGPNAVILSNREVDNGVEIIAAVDFDEILLDVDAVPPALQATAPRTPASGAAVPAPAAPVAARAEMAVAIAAPVRKAMLPAGQPRKPGPTESAAVIRPAAATGAPVKPAPAQKPPAQERNSVTAPAKRTAAASQEPTLLEIRHELKNLRGMLEHQIAGLIWGDVARRSPVKARLLRLLMQLNLSPGLSKELAAEADDSNDDKRAWRHALARFSKRLPVLDDEIIERGGVVALLGPTGVGKTTTVAKLAARYSVRHGSRKVGVITTDNFRIGAHEQLRIYARILDIPVRAVGDAQELKETIRDLGDRKLVLIDTAGLSQRDARIADQFEMLRQASSSIQNYLVLAATTNESALDGIIRRYRTAAARGCIVTKIDEAGSLGGILSLLIHYGLPLAYLSDGQRVPEDLSVARAHQVVCRSVAMMREGPSAQDLALMQHLPCPAAAYA